MEPTKPIRSDFSLLQARAACCVLVLSFLSILVPVELYAGVTVTTLFTFDGTNGGRPAAPLVQAPDNTFYGTGEGGLHGSVVFNLSASGDLKTLSPFLGGFDIWGPFVFTGDGTVYGTSYFSPSTSGAIFRLLPSGTFEILFPFNGTNGASPTGLLMGPDGAFYGVTRGGGPGYTSSQSPGLGTIFRIDTNGLFSTIVTFNATNGSSPNRMILGRDGAFYGTTHLGGVSITNFPNGYGTIFKLVPGGPLVTLHSFNNIDGAGPLELIQAADGALYGTAQAGGATATSPFGGYGTVYRVTTNSVFTKLADCDSATQLPLSIVQATDGTLYGCAAGASVATVFQVGSSGAPTVVYSFDSYGLPGSLVQMPGGSIYGTTRTGGIYSQGTIFRLDLAPGPPFLQILSVQTNQLALNWNASPGRNYQVQACGDLLHQSWTNVGNPFTATNSTLSFSPFTNPTQDSFYRVVLLP